jgi:hypothetical protein
VYAKCALEADVVRSMPPDHRGMAQTILMGAGTSWPDAAIAIAGVALVGSVVVIVVWQALATWRTRISVSREDAYRKLAERTARDLREIHEYIVELESERTGLR